MTSLYTAYATIINGKTFYIVKNYQTFPDYLDVAPVLEQYGMHINFYQACKIARIYDKEIQGKLFEKWEKQSLSAQASSLKFVLAEIYISKTQLAFRPHLQMAQPQPSLHQ